MNTTSSKSHRREFLQTSGICLALPWLERFAAANEADAALRRAVFICVPNGVNMWEWHPAKTGKDYELTPPLKNLADLRQRFTVFSGLQHRAQPGHGELGVWLTANANYTAGKGAVTQSTISIDQHIAETVGRQTRWPSMVVGATGGRRTISFDRQGEPVLADHDLSAIFAEIVGAQGREKLPRRASILDLISSQAADLRRELGKSDERKLDEYLDSVRAVEKRVQADIAWRATLNAEVIHEDRLRLQADPFQPADYAEYIDTMFELIYLALQTDSTRVVSFATTESEGGGPIKNLPCGNWHGTGHNTGDEPPDRKPKEYAILSEYDAWWTARLAKFLERLRTTNEGNHDMLRNTAVLYGSGMSWPATHRAHNLPLLLAGGEGLGFAQGQHLAFNGQQKVIPNDKREHLTSPKLGPDAVSMSDLLRTISEQMGVVAKGFGESRRTLVELLM
ncbi:DUF1552 domain-containing protein [Lignipirellula cremea]|uniref:DUF1552 domain-containing protein n=1 Tax=Lignipirellula cremea TaxID=2528010 RepID=A0A518DXI1_9BACT|nr:DUF1552 domain-containing protein [Lignipirellula cremea]QDU96543.1 hypothetical protein Pla8534_43640 [Lignipirellula cremea]